MRQLVGLTCVICGKKIGSVTLGRFCPECGCPVHNNCMIGGQGDLAEPACSRCGAKSESILREKALHEQHRKETGVEVSGTPAEAPMVRHRTGMLLRLLVGGMVCGVGGLIFAFVAAFNEPPSWWGAGGCLVVAVLGFTLVGIAIRSISKTR
jgi:hypothetical protein